MLRTGFQRFLEETEDSLIPPGMNLGKLPPTTCSLIQRYHDLQGCIVDKGYDFVHSVIRRLAFRYQRRFPRSNLK